MKSSRFECPSAPLQLKGLLKRTHITIVICFCCAATFHGVLSLFSSVGAVSKPTQPLTTQFIKRQPRLTKPLELKKRPRPKRRMMQRKMVSVKARVDRTTALTTFQSQEVLSSLSRPEAHIHRKTAAAHITQEPTFQAWTVQGTRESQHRIDMNLELIDVQALDTGRYEAMVIQDPNDKRNVRGFFHLALVYSVSMRQAVSPQWFDELHGRDTFALSRVIDAVNRYTDIKADMRGHLTYDAAKLLKIPWIYNRVAGTFKLNGAEALNFGRYLTRGGFFFGDAAYHTKDTAEDFSIRRMITDGLATQSLLHKREWEFAKIPNDHPIYHCFFDFDGPPVASDYRVGHYAMKYFGGNKQYYDFLEGVMLGARLVAIVSVKDFAVPWGDWARAPGYLQYNPTRPLQFAVNLIVFALTQEGSITNRVMGTLQ